MKRTLTADYARALADPVCNFTIITYDEVEQMIYEAACNGKRRLILDEKNILPATVRKLQRRGFIVADHRSAAYIQPGKDGIKSKGHWTISW